MRYRSLDEAGVRALGADLARTLRPDDVVLLEGPLGAGKTTLVRGLLAALGWTGAVRSPTFTLLQAYPTDPPVLHADLYRLSHAAGFGLEEEMAGRIALVEWPDRLGGLVVPAGCWRVSIAFAGDPDAGLRDVDVTPPDGTPEAPIG